MTVNTKPTVIIDLELFEDVLFYAIRAVETHLQYGTETYLLRKRLEEFKELEKEIENKKKEMQE